MSATRANATPAKDRLEFSVDSGVVGSGGKVEIGAVEEENGARVARSIGSGPLAKNGAARTIARVAPQFSPVNAGIKSDRGSLFAE